MSVDRAAEAVEVCGRLTLRGPDGQRVEASLGGRRGEVAFAFLVLHRERPIEREALAAILWPDGLPATWASALRTALVRVRAACAALGMPDALIAERGVVQVVLPAEVHVDLDRARAQLRSVEADPAAANAIADARAAAATLAAPVLPEIEALWVDEIRRGAEHDRLRALDALAVAALRHGDGASALDAAEQAVGIDPLRESSVRALMEAHRIAGRRSDALRAYEQCRAVLAEQLGVRPSPETEAAYIEVLGEPDVAPVARAEPSPGLPAALQHRHELPFVGRDHELETLHTWWGGVTGGNAGFAVVRGDAGIGKSRLVRELARRVHAAGARVLYARFDERDRASFRPIAALVDGGAADSTLSVGGTDRREVFDEIADALIEIARSSRGLLLVVDDIQWAGPAAIAALEAIARDAISAAVPLGVLMTLRTADLEPDHAARALIASAIRNERMCSVDLDGLDGRAVGDLLSRIGGAELDATGTRLAESLQTQGAGNPFFVGETLRDLLDRGAIVCDADGRWSGAALPTEVAPAIRDVVLSRISGLGSRVGEVLRTAAVIGPTFELALLGECVDGGIGDAVDAVDAAIRAQLVWAPSDQPGVGRFVHEVVQVALLESLSMPARLSIHRRVGLAIEPRPRTTERLYAMARHFTAAASLGDTQRAVDATFAAGAGAMRDLAYEEAAAMTRAALELDIDDRDRAALLVALGDADILSGDSSDAHDAYRAAADAAQRAADPALRARAVLGVLRGHRGGSEWLPDADIRALAVAALAALDLAPDEPELVVRLLSQIALWTPEPQERRELADRAMAVATRVDSPNVIAAAYGASRITLWNPADTVARLAFADRVEAAATALDDPHLAAVVRFGSLGDLLQLGAVAEVRERLAVLRNEPVTMHSRRLRWQALVWDAVLEMVAGRLDHAEELAAAAFAEWGDEPHVDALQTLGSQLAVIRILQGRAAEIADLITGWVRDNPDVIGFRAVGAWVLAEAGRTTEARDAFDLFAADEFRTIPRDNTFPVCIYSLASAGAILGLHDHAEVLYEMALPLAGQMVYLPGIAAYLGPADHVLGPLAFAAGRVHDAHRHLEVAVEQASVTGGEVWAQRSRDARADG